MAVDNWNEVKPPQHKDVNHVILLIVPSFSLVVIRNRNYSLRE